MARLDELLSRNLGISKTAARRLIAEERVRAPDGTALSDPRAPVALGPVTVDGAPVTLYQRALVLLHKPVGVVTALRDARHATAYALLRGAPLHPELRAVGRLDLDTSGLLLWSTDGALIQRLTHPKRRVPRTYQAALARPLAADASLRAGRDLTLADGHRPEIEALGPLAPADVHPALAAALAAAAGTAAAPPLGVATPLATITLIGGAYHEVRRIFAALGNHVVALCRTRFGPYVLPSDLPPGAWRPLPDQEPEPEPAAARR